ncbi:MAG: FtsX-like permease family protein [Saprospiraceae bacterium]|nr:FtsX-like permease family protein [Saprospiraceae bacterium]
MKNVLKIIWEAANLALGQLRTNKTRSFLSLIGITIGIFCIIGVGAAVDSLEDNVRESFNKLGEDVLYITKFTWEEDPGANYWKWRRRPNPDYDDFKALKRKLKSAESIAFQVFVGVKTAKWRNKALEETFLIGVTEEYGRVFGFKFDEGRFFSSVEANSGSEKCLLGYTVAMELFGTTDIVGRQIKLDGRSLEIVGVLEESGDSIINIMNFDEGIIIPYKLANRMANFKSNSNNGNSMLAAKAGQGKSISRLKDEITGVLRSSRKLKPTEENDFAVNNVSIFQKLLDSFFGVINSVGLLIGLFAILVGVFSVANIMFVSVKERTNIIGIKKALGAKRWVILMEFLIESAILCLIGGALGLVLVQVGANLLSNVSAWEIYLSPSNIIQGTIWSIAIGVAAGIIPAWQAATMDPVEAIRSK